jgi:hypothetical protein
MAKPMSTPPNTSHPPALFLWQYKQTTILLSSPEPLIERRNFGVKTTKYSSSTFPPWKLREISHAVKGTTSSLI